jgi:hypothetical protein
MDTTIVFTNWFQSTYSPIQYFILMVNMINSSAIMDPMIISPEMPPESASFRRGFAFDGIGLGLAVGTTTGGLVGRGTGDFDGGGIGDFVRIGAGFGGAGGDRIVGNGVGNFVGDSIGSCVGELTGWIVED